MEQKNLSTPVVAVVIALVVILVGVFLYKGVTGGTVGDGKAGNVEASPPMPNAARQQTMQSHMRQ